MQNLGFILQLFSELARMGAQAVSAARGDERKALDLIRDRTNEIAALEADNDRLAEERILGGKTATTREAS